MSFDLVAPIYRALETFVFGSALQRARTAFLSQLHHSRHALLAGEGNGRFLAQVRATFPQLRIDCVDSSAQMLRLSQRTITDTNGEQNKLTGNAASSLDFARDDRIWFIQADLRVWNPVSTYDVVVTHFFLDCFEAHDLALVVDKLNAVAATKARWLISEFTLPPGRVARSFARALIAIMYRFFRVAAAINATHLIDYRPLLVVHGFSCTHERFFYFGMVKAELWER